MCAQIFHRQQENFLFIKGEIFSNLILKLRSFLGLAQIFLLLMKYHMIDEIPTDLKF